MNKICLILSLHQSLPLRPYRFFEIGDHAPYRDEDALVKNTSSLAHCSYLPVNQLLLRHIKNSKNQLRVAIYLSGLTAGNLEKYAEEAYDSFRQLADTGCVEFLSGTFSWSLASLFEPAAFLRQMNDHRQSMERLTGRRASDVFINTGLYYDNRIGALLTGAGMEGVITEGDKQLLGWKSPDALYSDVRFPGLKMFFTSPERNAAFLQPFSASKDQKQSGKFRTIQEEFQADGEDSRLFNLMLPYNLLSQQKGQASGNLHLLDHFLYTALRSPALEFCSPSDLLHLRTGIPVVQTDRMLPVEGGNNFLIYDPDNDLQQEALTRLYEMTGKMGKITDPAIWHEWNFLQSSCHIEYMANNYCNPEPAQASDPCSTPYGAFINFMNVLNDFNLKLDQHIKY